MTGLMAGMNDWINGWDLFGDFLLKDFAGEKLKKKIRIGFRDLFINNLVNPSSDLFLLRSKCIVCFSLLVWRFTGESNNKCSNDITILRFTILNSFNKCFSFFYYSWKLILKIFKKKIMRHKHNQFPYSKQINCLMY